MTIVIFVRGGCVENVAGAPEHTIIDWDDCEGGSCPICRGELEFRGLEQWCPGCEVNWDQATEEEILEVLAQAASKPPHNCNIYKDS